MFTLSATGLVSFRPDRTFYPPDGGPMTVHRAGAENGIAAFTAPQNAILGVFLADAQPSLTPAPAAFTHLPDAPVIAPSLKQVFFIGDGMTSTATIQRVLVHRALPDSFSVSWTGLSGATTSAVL